MIASGFLRFGYLICWVLIVVTMVAFIITSSNVMLLTKESSRLRDDIADAEESLKLLSAEWAYLSSPENIERLAMKYMNLGHYCFSLDDASDIRCIDVRK